MIIKYVFDVCLKEHERKKDIVTTHNTLFVTTNITINKTKQNNFFVSQNNKKQEMCASQNMLVYINYQTVKNYIYSNGDLDL